MSDSDKCESHDKCFNEISAKLDVIGKSLTDILVRLERGSGKFTLLDHRVKLTERIVFSLVGMITGGVITAILLYFLNR